MSVAVVIPLYNKAATIARALTSVQAQTLPPDEVLVVDDGSTDGGADVVAAQMHPALRLIRQPNGGVSVARNRGANESRSDWVAFLDADDEWHPAFLASVIRMAEQEPQVGVVFSNLRLSTGPAAWLAGDESGRLRDYFDFFVRNGGHGMSASSVLAKRSVLLKVGGFPPGLTHGEDLDTWTRLAWETPVAFVPEVLAVYHVAESGRAMQAGGSRVAAGLAHNAQRCLEQLRDGRVPPALIRSTRVYAQMLNTMCARELKDAGHTMDALQALARTFPPVITVPALGRYTHAVLRSLCPSVLLGLRRTSAARC